MSDESRIDSILGDWRARRDEGETLSIDDVIAAHPDLAESLRARFDALSALAAAKQPSLRDVPADRYAEFRVLGQGGMGIVYWALDTDLNRQVAFKVVRPDAGQSGAPTPAAPIELAPPSDDTPASAAFATLKARFLQEAWVTAGLEHPGIVPVYEVGQTPEGVPYYTMRFVRGSRTLAAAIEDVRGKSIDERLALLEPFLKVCDTIRYAHAHGVIHRDLKPDNVALGEFGEVVVLDWGLAKMSGKPDAFAETWQHRLQEYRDASDLKTMASALGTPGYMAPEAALGRTAEVDAKSDVYSLGAMLFQILVGRLPYEFRSYGELAMRLMKEDAPDAASIDPTVPAELARICAAALARDRAQRTASIDALVADVRGWLAQREQDRELDALREQSKAAFDAASTLTGDLRLHQLDRAASACDQVLARRADDATAMSLRREIDALRAKGIDERARAVRGTAMRRAGVAALVFLVVAGAVVGKTLDDRRKEAEDARADTAKALGAERDERIAKDAALAKERSEREAKDAALVKERDERAAKEAALALAEKARARAEGLRLVAESNMLLSADPTLALLLACEGHARVPGLAARNAVLGALQGLRESRVLLGLTTKVTLLTFDRDGGRLLAASTDGTARVWNVADGSDVCEVRTGEMLTSAGFSSDGARIVTASIGGFVRTWDAKTGAPLVTVGGKGMSALASADGRVAVLRQRRTAKSATETLEPPSVWDLTTGAKLGVVSVEGGADVRPVALSPDGSRLVVFTDVESGADRLSLIDTSRGVACAELPQELTAITPNAAFSADGSKLVLTWATSPRIVLVDARTGTMLSDMRVTDVGELGAIAWDVSEDGTRVLVGAGPFRVVDVVGRTVVCALDGIRGGLVKGKFSPDGRRVAFNAMGGQVGVFDISTRTVTPLGEGLDVIALAVAFDPRGGAIAMGTVKGPVRMLRAQGFPVVVLSGHSAAVQAGEFSPNGSRVVTLAADCTARVWNAGDGVCTAELRGGKGVPPAAEDAAGIEMLRTLLASGSAIAWVTVGPVVRAGFSGDGTRICTTMLEDDYRSHAFDAVSGRDLGGGLAAGPHDTAFLPDGLRVIEQTRGQIWSIDVSQQSRLDFAKPTAPFDQGLGQPSGSSRMLVSADGRRVALVLVGDVLGVWDCASGELVREIPNVEMLHAISPDAGRLLVTDSSGSVRIVCVDPKGPPVELAQQPVPAGGKKPRGARVIASRDLRRICTGSDDAPARVWDGATGALVSTLRSPPALTRATAISNDGRMVATISTDLTARVWDAQSGEELLTLRGHGGFANSATFSPDGKYVLTTSMDKTARIWPVDPIAVAAAVAPRKLTDEERVRYDLGPADAR